MISGLGAEAFRQCAMAGADLAVRKAVMHDIPAILDLINGYAAKGIMLPRTELEVSEALRDFSVVRSGGSLLGCGALHFYSPSAGEIRSLAVAEHAKTHGVGRRLVEALIEEAQRYELDALFAFTYVVDFFTKLGFREIERGLLPLKAWKDCLPATRSRCCAFCGPRAGQKLSPATASVPSAPPIWIITSNFRCPANGRESSPNGGSGSPRKEGRSFPANLFNMRHFYLENRVQSS